MKASHFGDGSPLSRAQSALAHALIYVLAVAIPIRAASWFGLLTDTDIVVSIALLTCWGTALFHRHKDHLCARCMDEVPVDAPTRAQRRQRSLRFFHFATTVPATLVMIVLLSGPAVFDITFHCTVPRPYFIPGDIWTFALIYTASEHHRLRPWCPYCRPWDDGGDEEPAPDPTLFGTKTGS
jgi:hypothetical protein